MIIKDSFVDIEGNHYQNVREIAYIKDELFLNLGEFKNETLYIDSNFSPTYFFKEGVYIYKSYYDNTKALRIYKNFADYGFNSTTDAGMIQKLQTRQKKILLTNFPTGVVTLNGKIIGQEMLYYDGYITLYEYCKSISYQEKKSLIIKVIKILIELESQGIFYKDIHLRNFLIDSNSLKIELIDFDSYFISFDKDGIYAYKYMINNLNNMLKKLEPTLNISYQDINKIEQFLVYID